jgi:putative SOS response-associated peptidase YedK
MCGRYGASWGLDDLIAEFEVDSVDVPAAERLPADWNVAPTKPVYAILTRRQHAEDASTPASRRLVALRWGLVPSWAKDAKIGARMINARVETAATKPAFRQAFALRRCLLPADGYYEWYTPEALGAGSPRPGGVFKQPFFIRRRDGGTLAMAGLYEFWRNPGVPRDDPSAWLRTCTILTTTAGDSIGGIHDRQPLFVEPRSWTAWLDPDRRDPAGLADLLVVSPVAGLDAYPVSTAVNDHRNNGPELVTPLPDAQTLGIY